MHVPVRELNPWEPVANVIELAREPAAPALVLRLPRSLSVAALSPLIPVRFGGRLRLAGRDAEHSSDGFLSDSLVLVEPLVGLRSRILLVLLGLVWLRWRPISLHLGVSVSASHPDFLPAHRTVLATILNQLDCAELMKEMPAGKPASGHHLILADRTVFKLADLPRLELFLSTSLNRVVAAWVSHRSLVLRVLLDDEFDQRKIPLKPFHELAELDVFRNVLVHLH